MKKNNSVNNTLTGLLASVFAVAMVAGCASNPHKAEKIDTTIEKGDKVTGDQVVGVKDGNMIVQNKVQMSEELRKLQYEVYGLEDKVYGNRKYGSDGMYGVLKKCRLELSDVKNGGDGKIIWTESIDRVTDKDEELKMGLDEKEKLVGVSEEMLKDRIKRFREYRNILEKREEEYRDKLDVCQLEVKTRKQKKEGTN